jgi:hypothetical protein
MQKLDFNQPMFVNPHTLPAEDFVQYEGEFDQFDDSQWGQCVLQLVTGERDEGRYLRDPEAIRCAKTGYSPVDIYLGKRQYTDVQLGMLDGPVRDNPKGYLDLFQWTARTPKASLTKRQRSKLRKAKRRAKRKGEAFVELEFIAGLR